MKQLRWFDTAERHTLSARIWVALADAVGTDRYGFATAADAEDLDPVQAWCEQHDCGVRTSFDTFRFRDQQEVTMFLLRWA